VDVQREIDAGVVVEALERPEHVDPVPPPGQHAHLHVAAAAGPQGRSRQDAALDTEPPPGVAPALALDFAEFQPPPPTPQPGLQALQDSHFLLSADATKAALARLEKLVVHALDLLQRAPRAAHGFEQLAGALRLPLALALLFQETHRALDQPRVVLGQARMAAVHERHSL